MISTKQSHLKKSATKRKYTEEIRGPTLFKSFCQDQILFTSYERGWPKINTTPYTHITLNRARKTQLRITRTIK